MRYLKTYELFGFGSKKPKTWKEKFQDVIDYWNKIKNQKDLPFLLPTVTISDDQYSVSIGWSTPNLAFYGQNSKGRHKLEVVDFDEVDMSDLDSNKGSYKITIDEYNHYLKKTQEISDWLDDISEKKFGKSSTEVSDSGELHLDFNEGDIALEELNDKIKSELKIIGKKYEFEMSYHLWTSKSTNKLVVERRELIINDLKFDFGGRFWCQLFTIDPFGEKAQIWLESDSSSEYYDLESNKWPYDHDKIIDMSTIKKEMARKEEREYDKNRKFPYAFAYDITPSKYESIEMVKEITNILEMLNSQIKTKK
jgi:hypothetical protein